MKRLDGALEHEFYMQEPELSKYRKGKTKYIVITGSVMSGVGKGTFSGCLAALLACHGLNISPLKFDGYLNYDAGTLNPYRHGEVFVLDDGTECDLDLGSYERFLHKDLSKDNYLTAGKIFKSIIEKERKGKFLGRDVQFIPHVTGEIKAFVRKLALKTNADIVLIEVGGTVGDIENSYFIEAMRELRHEEGKENVCFINVTYIIQSHALSEQKSKAAQLGLRTLMGLGIQPDIVVCRSEFPIDEKIREKISIYSNLPLHRIYNLYNLDIYEIPLMLRKFGIDKEIFKILNIRGKRHKFIVNFKRWENFATRIRNAKKEITIAIVGKYTYVKDSYLSIVKALEHASAYYSVKINIKWIEATDVEDKIAKIKARRGSIKDVDNFLREMLRGVDGIIVPGGFGKRGIEGKIALIRYAREKGLPFLGLCLGLQLAVIEFARNVCGIKDANTTEIASCANPVIDIIPEQEENLNSGNLGGTMRLGSFPARLKPGTLVARLYGRLLVNERHRHRWEVNPKYVKVLERHGMIIAGIYEKRNLVEFIELSRHRFFVATQAHAEFKSRPFSPHPLFLGLVKACLERNLERKNEIG